MGCCGSNAAKSASQPAASQPSQNPPSSHTIGEPKQAPSSGQLKEIDHNQSPPTSTLGSGQTPPGSGQIPPVNSFGSPISDGTTYSNRPQTRLEQLTRKATLKYRPDLFEPPNPRAQNRKRNKTYIDATIAEASSALSPMDDGSTANGFLSIDEPETLNLNESDISEFSMPQEVLALEKAPLVVQYFSNGDKERKIYCNVEYDAEEQKLLEALSTACNEKKLSFYPSTSSNSLRCVSHTKGNVDKALNMMEFTQRWRIAFFAQPLTAADVREDLKHGFLYWAGRDCRLIPALVFRAKRIPQKWLKARDYDRIIKAFVFCLEYFLRYMTLAGRVESFLFIIDLAGMGVSSIPVSALADIQGTMGGHYCGRCAGTFVCNMSWTMRSLVGVAKGLMTERQVQKLCFVKDAKAGEEFKERFALHQLEQDFGGTTPNLQEFFPFALLPGPFDAGNSSGKRPDAVPRCYEAFTRADVQGRVWNADASEAENTKRKYTSKAASIYESCGLPLPADLAAKIEKSRAAKEYSENGQMGDSNENLEAVTENAPLEPVFRCETWSLDGKRFTTL